MISMTKLLTGKKKFGDKLRYTEKAGHQKAGTAPDKGPVVVWNCTPRCNLDCRHCYASSGQKSSQEVMDTETAREFIDQLAEFSVPVLLFSGGEPLLRNDIFTLLNYCTQQGIRTVISTNGTQLTPENVKKIQQTGVSYVGVSLDGIGPKNDEFRGQKGAYSQTLAGIRNCLQAGQKVGLRFTISRYTYSEVKKIFHLVEKEGIPRLCFYHLVYSGRGSELKQAEIEQTKKRELIDYIINKTEDFSARGIDTEILTVDNHVDGIYTYLRYKESNPERAEYIYRLLAQNGGNRSGQAFACVDWKGDVHPDQFTWQTTFGNIQETDFAQIWSQENKQNEDKLHLWRNRKEHLQGRCANCKWLKLCNGNLRARARAVHGDLWAPDPACYLTEEEI